LRCCEEVVPIPAINGRPVISRADMAARGVPRTTVDGWYRDRARTGYPEKAGRIGRTDYWYEDEWTAWHEAQRARHKGKAVTNDDKDVPTLGPETIAAAVHLMSRLYTMAMREAPPIVTANPFAALELPAIQPHAIDFFEHGEAEALFDAVEELSGKAARTLIELGMWVGLRPGELYGLHGHRVNWLRGTVEVIDVMTRNGPRQWPKRKKSHRVVPVPGFVMDGMSACMTDRARDALVFTAPEGGPINDANLRTRIWYPGIAAAGIRPLPPKYMRHTAASWLVQDGVPLYDVQALLGHESFQTTERYAHLAPDAHDRVLKSWAGHTKKDTGARVAHGDDKRG
jgi:integrase